MKSCRRCVISGRVQGVFFRQSTQEQAERLAITGWVRNLENGDVECVICGESNVIEALFKWLHEGPPRAEVLAVHYQEIAWEDHEGFRILR